MQKRLSVLILSIFFFACFVSISKALAEQVLSELESLQWQNRIILVRSSTNCEPVQEALKQASAEIDDRDIIWFIFCETQATQLLSNYEGVIGANFLSLIQKRYFKSKSTNVILIGKDGDIKYRANQLDLDRINQRIDSMPMRQQEMHERAENVGT